MSDQKSGRRLTRACGNCGHDATDHIITPDREPCEILGCICPDMKEPAA